MGAPNPICGRRESNASRSSGCLVLSSPGQEAHGAETWKRSRESRSQCRRCLLATNGTRNSRRIFLVPWHPQMPASKHESLISVG